MENTSWIAMAIAVYSVRKTVQENAMEYMYQTAMAAAASKMRKIVQEYAMEMLSLTVKESATVVHL
jgi:hypothetical protein